MIAIAESDSKNPPSGLHVTRISEEEVGNAGAMEKLDLYLKLGEECVEAVQKMSLRKFNNEQCGYLADKLQVVVQRASLFVEVLQAEHHGHRSVMDVAKQVEIFKFQLALAKQIENFVEGCCKDLWIQSAMTLTNVWEYVASIGFNLELCRVAFCTECAATGGLTLDEVEDMHKAEVEIVTKKASADVDTLFQKLIFEMPSLSSDDKDLACYLIQRLKQVERTPASNLSGSFSGSVNGDHGGFLGILFKWVKPGRQLGKGSFATVEEAMWLGTPVAKKTFHGPENPDFMKEVKVLSPLCHPNVMSLYCCAKNRRSCSIIMELMDEDLHRLMERRLEGNNDSPPFPILEAVDIMLQIGEGVKYLHSQRIVHRDLKSMNILVKSVTGQDSKDGYVHVKVADFGLAKTKERSIRYSTMSSNVGTHRWMPPEIINLVTHDQESSSMSIKEPKYPLKCDTYSFGMVCFEILTGDIPFPTIYNPNEVKKQVIHGERPKLPKDPNDCPHMLKDLIERCWSSDPKERPNFIAICAELKYLKYLLMTGEMTQEATKPTLYHMCNFNSKKNLDNHMDSPFHDEDFGTYVGISKVGIVGGRILTCTTRDSYTSTVDGIRSLHLPTTSASDNIYHNNRIQDKLNELHKIVSGLVLEQATSGKAFSLGSGQRFESLPFSHRGTAIRILENYHADFTELNVSLDNNLQNLVEDNQAFLNELVEANRLEPDSSLTWQQRRKLSLKLKDYQTTLSAALRDEDDEEDDVPDVDDVEFKSKKDVAHDGIPLSLYEATFSSGPYVESLASALDLCETQVLEFKKLLPIVRFFHRQCKNLVETLEPTAEWNFAVCHKVLDALKRLEVDGGGFPSGSQLNNVHFCFESLVGLAQKFQLVEDLLRKCASENLLRTALELADLPSPSLMSKRCSEFSLAIQNCSWSMDLVEFAFYTLEKLLTGATHIFQDLSFKWSEKKCRMVLQIEGKLGIQDRRLEKSVLDMRKELEKQDMDDLIDQLRHMGESANGGSQGKLNIGIFSRAAYDIANVANFLCEKLSGPIPHARYLPWTFRVDPSTLKFREYLNSGGAGMVAKYTWFGEDVAVKCVRSPSLTRHKFEKEVAILATLQHPNVVRLIGCGFIDTKPGTGMLVMELMDFDLRTVIESRVHEHLGPGSCPFTSIVAIDIIMQIAQAMRYLKDHKVLHMDLQAKNILVKISQPLNLGGESNTTLMRHADVSTVLPHRQEKYVAKLADFGLARCRPHSTWARSRMASTIEWRAPEDFHVLDTEVTHEYKWPADVYSFAMTCYEILTGKSPFADLTSESIYKNVMAGKRPEGLDELDIPDLLKELVKKCWATNPDERPTFDEIVKSLWECRLKAILPGFERQICGETISF